MKTTKTMTFKNCAYSLNITRVKERDFPYSGRHMSAVSEVLDFVHSLQNADDEKFIAIYLDNQNKVICLQVTPGIVNQAVVYPRAILRHALLVNASAIIMVHNHPSGNEMPSDADIRLTRIIKETGKALEIVVHDHIIITPNSHYSFQEGGVMPS